ncbi:MAG: TIGR00341 family protein [Halioglobus sp.]|nr:TIGR00341 family protein [Halioglobus sp.]
MAEDVALDPELTPLFLLHDASLEADAIAELAALASVTFVTWAERETPPRKSRVLFFLGDEMIREAATLALELQWEVGVLPHREARQAMTALGVRGELQSVFQHYLTAPAIEADALTCNDELVFTSVVIGRVLALRPYDINRPQTAWNLVTGAFRGLGKLKLALYHLTTGKEKELHLAALGMVVMGQTQSALVGRSFTQELGVGDRRLSVLALAPRSITSYLWFLLRLLWPKKFSLARLPASLGLIQTDRLRIVAPRGMEYLLDGKPVHTSEIEFKVLEGRLRLLPGPAMAMRSEAPVTVSKETVRLNHIPQQEEAGPLLQQPLPLFSHATEEEYRELFVALRDSARVTPSYQVLMVLSVLLALAGLYANSAPVIIGAMILAPLMSPIVSLAMGLARSDIGLIRSAMKTLSLGVAWGLVCGILMAWLMPLDLPTDEMKMRMAPTLLDLLVAVISGVACAYANAKEEIAKSLAGVAIAVALVPPLSVVGIGVGWGDWGMAAGASLLLITNLVGIALAASVTFLVLGFSPFKRARAGLGFSLLLLAAISVPLSLSFAHLVERQRILERISTGDIQLQGLQVHVDHAEVTLSEPPLVSLELSAREQLNAAQVSELKVLVSRELGQDIQLEVQSNIRL